MSTISKFLGNILSPNNWSVFSRVHLADGVGNGSSLHQTRITLTAAQIKALHTTPITLIPAQGAGIYISVVEVMGYLNYGTAQMTGSNAIELRYTDGSGSKVTGDIASAFLDGSASAAVKAVGAAVTPLANAPVVAAVPTANPAAGDSTLTLEIFWRFVTLP